MSAVPDGDAVGVASAGALRLLWWFPKAGTPNCARQAADLRASWSALAEDHVEVVGCSLDSQVDLDRWGTELALPFALHAATTTEAASYGALREDDDPWRGSLARRVAVLVDDVGDVLDRWDVEDPTMFAQQVTDRVAALR